MRINPDTLKLGTIQKSLLWRVYENSHMTVWMILREGGIHFGPKFSEK